MNDIQDKLNAYKKAISLKENIPAWIAYHIKTPLSKNITVTEWNAIVENVKELASDDEATVTFITQLTDIVNEIHSRVGTLSTQISSKSQAHLYGTFTDFISDLISGIDIGINQGDTVFTIQKGSPDFIVVNTDVHSDYLPNTVPIPDIDSIPTSPPDAGVIYFVANKYYIMAIESGVSAPDLGIDSELDLYSPRAVMNSAITAAINNINNRLSGANQAIVRFDYYDLVDMFNDIHDRELYKVGTNVYVIEKEVPDLWISYIEHSHHEINAEDFSVGLKEAIIEALKNDGSITIGYYTFSVLETQKVDLTEYPTNDDLKNELREFSEGYDIYLNNTFATKDDLNTLSDEFSQVLTDLHNYAMSLKGGEA